MPSLQRMRAEREVNKHIHLFRRSTTNLSSENSTLYDALNSQAELTIARLGVQGAYVVLTDGEAYNIVAGGHCADSTPCADVRFGPEERAWLGNSETDQRAWLWLFRQTLAEDTPARRSGEHMFSVASLRETEQTSRLSSVAGGVQLKYFAGIPIASKNGQNVGALFVVGGNERKQISPAESDYLGASAWKCAQLMEFAREREYHNTWSSIQEQLDLFVRSRAMLAQVLEEPPTLRRKHKASQPTQSGMERVDPGRTADKPLAGVDGPGIQGEESERLVQAEVERDQKIAEEDNKLDARTLMASAADEVKRGEPKGETTFRKLFRRAAECLREGLKANGVLFVDGLVGFHGGIQPVPEPEQELEREMARPAWRASESGEPAEYASSPPEKQDFIANSLSSNDIKCPSEHTTRVFTSAEFQRGALHARPAEILGTSFLTGCEANTRPISESTDGLAGIDEGFLQKIMDRHPDGAVWYFYGSTAAIVKDNTLVEEDFPEEMNRLLQSFPLIKQLLFMPLTDPTSLKRLAGCFVWRDDALPVYTRSVDLASLKGFLHVVESEIARFDAAAAVKQQETFVSSVSHELRTPLHGILGAVQLLEDANLDPMHEALISTIASCGSTLHETLTSVLSYAKINQFERRQHKYRQRRPPDTVWALPEKHGTASGPDRDFKGLYICTNVAMLCEEIVGVLQAGQSFTKPAGEVVMVALNVSYDNNWLFHTEPGAIRRIAVNLLGNALKYTSKGSIIVALRADQLIGNEHQPSNDTTCGRTVTLSIKDTGKGISKDFIENQLFVPFTQEHTATSQGVGLGMSIVKSLVALLGGQILVESEVNKGTEITVIVPMRFCSVGRGVKDPPGSDFEEKLAKLRKQRLSVVVFGFPDFVRQSLVLYLGDWFHCAILESTEDAKPDVVLVDEKNTEIEDAVHRTAPVYGKRGVLLSIVMTQKDLAKPMKEVKGYKKWERMLRPLGPNSVAKGLLSCVAKLEVLKKYGGDAETDTVDTGRGENDSGGDAERQIGDGNVNSSEEDGGPTRKRSRLSEGLNDTSDFPRLPTAIAEPSSKGQEHSPSASKPLPNGQLPEEPRVLIVDDNALNLKLLGAFIRKYGYRDVQQAGNGAKAVEAFERRCDGFDIIFMDLSMPVMDGFEATRRIRRLESERTLLNNTTDPISNTHKAAIIVALTGLASGRDEEDAFAAGVDMFITKPVRFNELSTLLKQCEDGSIGKREGEEGEGR